MLLTLAAVKSRNARMLARLRKLGVDIKNTQGLEALAAIENFADWNKFEAHLQNQPQMHQLRMAPALPQPPRFLVLSPGSGKSAIMQLLAAQCAAKGRIVVCIDFSGNGFQSMPLAYSEQMEVIPVTFDQQGDVIVEPVQPRNDKPIKLLQFATAGLSRHAEDLGKAFAAVAQHMVDNWSSEVLDKIGLVLVDEFHRIQAGMRYAVHITLPLLHTLGALLVVGSQVYPFDLRDSPLNWRVITTKDIDSQANAQTVHAEVSHVFLDDCVNLPPSFSDDTLLVEAFSVYIHMTTRRKAYNFHLGPYAHIIDSFSNAWLSESKRRTEILRFFRELKSLKLFPTNHQLTNVVNSADVAWRTEVIECTVHRPQCRIVGFAPKVTAELREQSRLLLAQHGFDSNSARLFANSIEAATPSDMLDPRLGSY